MANKKRTNTWKIASFVKLIQNSYGKLGVAGDEEVIDIKVLNGTVVLSMQKKETAKEKEERLEKQQRRR